MASSKPDRKTQSFDLGGFRVDPQRRTISGPDGETTIEPKIMAVLLMLAEHPGKVISREAFLDSVWSDEYGGDESLTRAISHLRKAFSNDRDLHVCIETIPRTGYRLVDPQGFQKATAQRASRHRLATTGIVIVLAVMFALVFLIDRSDDEVFERMTVSPASVVLAVLPFKSQSEATEDTSLARGLANEILSALSQSTSISVIAGNSSFQFPGDYKQNLEVLSQQLKASHVVEGLVQRSPGGLQVSVRLIDARTGLVVWSDVMTRPASEIYTIPNLMATEIQAALDTSSLTTGPQSLTPDPAAYTDYLQAKALIRETSDWNLGKAIRILEDVVSRDPGLSEAWAALAWARLDLVHVGGSAKTDSITEGPLDHLQAARRDANAALAIDPTSVDALLVLAIINLMDRTDTLVETESRISSLLVRAPNHPNVNMRMGLLLMSVGRWQEATIYMKTALDLNPLSSLTRFYYGTALLGSGDTEKIRTLLVSNHEKDSYRRSYPWLVERLLAKDYLAARDFFTPLESNSVFHSKGLGLAENIDADSPRAARLRSLVDRLVTAAERADAYLDVAIGSDMVTAADEGLIPHHFVCLLLAAAGLNDAAFDLAGQRISMGEVWYRELILMPAFGNARHDPRVMELFEATGQLDYWQQTGKWPDFCAEPDLPYECQNAALR